MSPPSRRAVLGALGAAGASALAGCAVDALDSALTAHDHYDDATLGPTHGWPTVTADTGNTSAALDGTPVASDVHDASFGRVDLGGFDAPAVANGSVVFGQYRHPGETTSGEEQFRTVGYEYRSEFSRPQGPVWSADVLRAHGPATIVGETAFVSYHGGTYALDRQSGEVHWHYGEGSSGRWLAPTVVDETVFLPFGDDSVLALDAVTGEHRWEAHAEDGAASSPSGVAVTDDRLYVTYGANDEGRLRAFDRTDRSALWTYDVLGESYAPPVVADGVVLAVGTTTGLHAVTPDGEQAWHHDLRGESYVPPATDGETAYVTGSNDEVVVALDARSGDVQWRFDDRPCHTPPVVVGDTLYTGDHFGHRGATLYALDRATGEHRRSHELRSTVETPLAAVDGRLYWAGQWTDEVGDRGSLFVLG
ncbi:PQQ-binding-like beta-propeller repeat protein [Halomarina rubra]|uniref:PQQ-binding-like beta-propeller repeat protein n=1 Tax=Halomarina rubra TaxID=2071873 RepID=A0ABD6AYF3_9EURY|nr:PQQ-binding-like beta-propeller repeat protein [Halomarina rubra]